LGYIPGVIVVQESQEFATWLDSLRDRTTRARILARLRRLAFGNMGDVAPVGDGISELRLHFGSGYRVYFVRRGDALILLLCGGDKSTQQRDIGRAKRLAQELEAS
jgi:putative addiction module killer protein